jgi:hypothetical protein
MISSGLLGTFISIEPKVKKRVENARDALVRATWGSSFISIVGLGQQFNKPKYLLAPRRDTVPWGESIIIKQTLKAHDDPSASKTTESVAEKSPF